MLEFDDLCNDYDVHTEYRTYFLRFKLTADVRQFFNAQVRKMDIKWNTVCDTFGERYASLSKQLEISNRLDALSLDDSLTDGEDDHAALDTLLAHIHSLVPMEKLKYLDDEAKVRYLTMVVVGTKWGLRAI